MDAPVATEGREHAEGDDSTDGDNHSKATSGVKRLRFLYERPGPSRFDKAALARHAKSVRHTARTVVPVATFNFFGKEKQKDGSKPGGRGGGGGRAEAAWGGEREEGGPGGLQRLAWGCV